MLKFFGILSGLLIIIADIPYCIDTLKKKTKPHRVSWFIFFILNLVGLLNQRSSGAKDSLFLFAGGTLATLLVFMCSLYYGTGGSSKLDKASFALAMVGIVLWQVFNSPHVSVIASFVVSAISLVPMYIKTWHQPDTETKITWLLGATASLLGLLSVGNMNFWLVVLPAQGFIAQLTMLGIIETQSRKHLRRHSDATPIV